MIKSLFCRTLLLASLLLSGCATSIGTYEQRPVSKGEAIVLMGVDSEIPLVEARYCDALCTDWITLGGRREIMAYPISIGSTFRVNYIKTADNRYARLKQAQELKVDRHGIYYYGTLYGTYSSAGINRNPSSRLLLAAKRKYGTRFDNLEPINFSWPDSAEDRNLHFGYISAAAIQEALRPHAGKRVQVVKIAAPASFDAQCRGIGDISLPDFLPYEEYIKRAINVELQAAKLYDDKSGAISLSGAITELSYSTIGGFNWKMGLRIDAPNGRSVLVNVTAPFEGAANGLAACAKVEDYVPFAVQKLIEALVVSSEFPNLLTSPSGQAVSR